MRVRDGFIGHAGRIGDACTFGRGLVAVAVFGTCRLGSVIGLVVRVHVGARGHHRPHGERADQDGRRHQPSRALPSLREKCTGVGGHDGQQSERGTRDVGELGRLTYFETVDP